VGSVTRLPSTWWSTHRWGVVDVGRVDGAVVDVVPWTWWSVGSVTRLPSTGLSSMGVSSTRLPVGVVDAAAVDVVVIDGVSSMWAVSTGLSSMWCRGRGGQWGR